jgi:TonB-dependent starch-binding outer membrane protein SusC
MAGTRSWLDFAKLRVGWGISGNDRIGNYNIFSTYGTNIHHSAYAIDGSNTSSVVGFQPSAVGNPNVTWETTETINLGLDLTVLNSTLNFSVDGWQRNTSDMLYRLSVPQVMGIATPPFVNIGEMKNTGLTLNWDTTTLRWAASSGMPLPVLFRDM